MEALRVVCERAVRDGQCDDAEVSGILGKLSHLDGDKLDTRAQALLTNPPFFCLGRRVILYNLSDTPQWNERGGFVVAHNVVTETLDQMSAKYTFQVKVINGPDQPLTVRAHNIRLVPFDGFTWRQEVQRFEVRHNQGWQSLESQPSTTAGRRTSALTLPLTRPAS